MNTIELIDLEKKYGDKIAVDKVSFSIKEGELFSLLGVNGAGKTTIIKMLTCLAKPTSGDAKVLGYSVLNETHKFKDKINVSPQETAIAPNLTVRENLEFIANIYGVKNCKSKVNKMIELFSLNEVEKSKTKILSGGYQRRLSIAMALITDPKVLFLDEPTLGLDVIARRELWKVIESLKGKTTVILTTHYMEEAEALSDRIAILSCGKLKSIGTAKELIELAKANNFEDAFVKLATEGGNI